MWFGTLDCMNCGRNIMGEDSPCPHCVFYIVLFCSGESTRGEVDLRRTDVNQDNLLPQLR